MTMSASSSVPATTQSAGHLLVQCLVAQGVSHVFGVPGESYLAALDGFHQHRDAIAFVTCRQEGGAAFMAEAHGKLTGRPGVCFVTRGPGATNASIGVHVAFQDSTPMVLLVGDVARDMRDREAFQALDYTHFFGPGTQGMAKRVERIDEPARLPEYIARAFATAINGRPGPAVLVLPEDVLAQHLPTTVTPLPQVRAAPAWSDPGALRELRRLLLASQRPLVIAGGGGWSPQSAQALIRFAENWQLPVGTAFRFQDLFDNHHLLYAGDVGIGPNPALAQRVQDADLLLVIGARLGEMTTNGYTLVAAPVPQQRLVHIHGGADELNRVYQPTMAIHSTMNAAARSLEVLTAPPEVPWGEWARAAHADYLTWSDPLVSSPAWPLPAPDRLGHADMAALMALAQELWPSHTVWTNGAGNFAGWLHRYHRYSGLGAGHRTQLAPTAGAMGYGVPAGIAASIATGRPVFTMAGDGDFLMNGQELATAVQHGARVTVVLLNNGLYGTIRMHQEREYPSRHTAAGATLHNPDFAALARAYGLHGERVTDRAGALQALRDAATRPQSTLIEVMLDPQVITTRTRLQAITDQALGRAAP
jgi:acetolactate synthase I/II/III large subunit